MNTNTYKVTLNSKEITNLEIIEILENSENYQTWLIESCEKELERRTISKEEIISLTREIFRKRLKLIFIILVITTIRLEKFKAGFFLQKK